MKDLKITLAAPAVSSVLTRTTPSLDNVMSHCSSAYKLEYFFNREHHKFFEFNQKVKA